MSEHKCEHESWQGWHIVRCGKPAKMEHEGQHYCGIHDPVKKAARQAERSAQRAAEWEARAHMNKERYAFEDAMKAATAGLSTATLTALAEAGGVKRVLELLREEYDRATDGHMERKRTDPTRLLLEKLGGEHGI